MVYIGYMRCALCGQSIIDDTLIYFEHLRLECDADKNKIDNEYERLDKIEFQIWHDYLHDNKTSENECLKNRIEHYIIVYPLLLEMRKNYIIKKEE